MTKENRIHMSQGLNMVFIQNKVHVQPEMVSLLVLVILRCDMQWLLVVLSSFHLMFLSRWRAHNTLLPVIKGFLPTRCGEVRGGRRGCTGGVTIVGGEVMHVGEEREDLENFLGLLKLGLAGWSGLGCFPSKFSMC